MKDNKTSRKEKVDRLLKELPPGFRELRDEIPAELLDLSEEEADKKLREIYIREQRKFRKLDKPVKSFRLSSISRKNREKFNRAWEKFKRKYPTDARRIHKIKVVECPTSYVFGISPGIVHLSKQELETETEDHIVKDWAVSQKVVYI